MEATYACLRLQFCAGAADRFRDPRVYAAERWYGLRLNGQKYAASYRRDKEGLPLVHRPPVYASNKPADKVQKKAEEAKREHEARNERARVFVRLMRAREKKEYAPHTFRLHEAVKAALAEKVETIIPGVGRMPWGEQMAREALKCFRAMELCEGALWGGALPETQAALAEMAAAVEAFTVERARVVAEKARV